MKTIPDVVILNIKEIIRECKEQLSQPWVFTVDIEFILQNLFHCFIDVEKSIDNLNEFIAWLKIEGLELKSDHSSLQIEFVLHVIEQTGKNILNVLVEHGYHTFEYFPYEFRKINTDDSVLLSRNFNYTLRI